MSLVANWNYPTNIRVGAGRVKELRELCRDMGTDVPLLVTDPGLSKLDLCTAILADLKASQIRPLLFADIKANPIEENIDAGVDRFKQAGCNGVIALGGGSALDAGKAIALMVGQQRSIWDFEDVGDNWRRVEVQGMVPVVAIPTTAGTGSEVGRASVITDQHAQRKKIIFHPRMLPAQVILDPELCVGLPPFLTAATGMDALSHNLEALCSPGYHPLAEGIAIEGIRLIRDFLPRAVANGADIEARTQMLVASCMGATAFQKGLGAMHALAHPLGALYDAHHGTLNAILMPYVLLANRKAVSDKLAALSRYLGFTHPDFDGFLNWVLKLRSEIGIPHTLADIGIDASHSRQIGEMAVQDPSAGGNPIAFSAAEYERLFLAAQAGQL